MRSLKGIVMLLVLANVGYFLWTRGIANPPPSYAADAPAPTLKLLAESGASKPAAATAAAAGAPAAGSEPASDATPAVVATGTPTASSASALLSDVKRCITIGPFVDVAEAVRAAATLRGGGYEPRQRVAEGEVWAGEWVYLRLPVSAAAVAELRAKLKAGGIDDALEMPGLNDGPVLSLGLFSEPSRAQTRMRQAQALGLHPEIADRKRTGDVYWVDIILKPTDSMLNPGDLEGQKGRIVRLQVKSCPAS